VFIILDDIAKPGGEASTKRWISKVTGGVINLFAVLLCLFIAGLQIRGIEESTKFNSAMVILKLAIILFVSAVGAFYVAPSNLTPFFPFGISGVLGGAALVFLPCSASTR
jgi:amino acid transporter